MARTAIEPSNAHEESVRLVGQTTIALYESNDGRWLATQRGVDVSGHGETAAEAATDYCRRIDAGTG